MTLVAHIADFGNPQPGSFIPCILELSESLKRRGNQLAFITSDIPNATWVREVSDSVSQLHLVSSTSDVCAILARIRPEIIHTHFYTFDVPVTLRMFFCNTRIFWHEHSLHVSRGLAARLRGYLKYHSIGSRVEAFVGVSDTVGVDLRSWGVPAGKVRIVLNGIDMDWFRVPTPLERYSARQEFGLDAEVALLLFGRDIYCKGVDLFWKALRLLDKPTVMLVGAPPEAQHEIASVAGRLISIDATKDVRKLYWAADLLAFPSRHESFGYVLVEALACGMPAVASDISAVREIVKGLDATYLVPPDDAVALAQAIKRAKYQRISRATRMQRFSLKRWTSDILALYDQPIQKEAEPSRYQATTQVSLR